MIGNLVLFFQGVIFYITGYAMFNGSDDIEKTGRALLTSIGGFDILVSVICLLKGF